MIKQLTDINIAIKVLRQMLINQSQLESNKVLNALSVYGPETLTTGEDCQFSFTNEDTFILFELIEIESSSNVDMTESDDSVSVYAAYEFKLIIYGTDSANIAQKIRGRFRTTKVLDELYAQGIQLYKVDRPTAMNEYINDAMYERRDMSIYFGCNLRVEQVTDYDTFAQLNDIDVVEADD